MLNLIYTGQRLVDNEGKSSAISLDQLGLLSAVVIRTYFFFFFFTGCLTHGVRNEQRTPAVGKGLLRPDRRGRGHRRRSS